MPEASTSDSHPRYDTAMYIRIEVDIDMGKSAVRKTQSPSHPIAVSMGGLATSGETQALFQPSQASVPNFVLEAAHLELIFIAD